MIDIKGLLTELRRRNSSARFTLKVRGKVVEQLFIPNANWNKVIITRECYDRCEARIK